MKFKPVLENRYFNAHQKYEQINWSDFLEVTRGFQFRIEEWYIRPLHSLQEASGNYGFAVMALDCLLIDTLSQYRYGELESDKKIFLKFIREICPKFKQKLPKPIQNKRGKLLNDAADVLYSYRCGILHEAHIPLYGGIPGTEIFEIYESGHVTYEDGQDCPSLIINPYKLAEVVELYFDDYIKQLLDQSNTLLRENFRKKFSASFGIEI